MASARAALLLRHQCLGAAAVNPYIFSGHGLRYRKLEVILTTVTAAPIISFHDTSVCKFVALILHGVVCWRCDLDGSILERCSDPVGDALYFGSIYSHFILFI
jgi:hypothetical protein